MTRVLSCILLFALTGCGHLFNQHAQMMDAMRGVMRETAARLGESGAGQIAAGGQVINPGLRVSGGVEYYATAQYEGVSGQVIASMAGQLDRSVPEEVQAQIDAIWRSTTLSVEDKTRRTFDILMAWFANASPAETAVTGDEGE